MRKVGFLKPMMILNALLLVFRLTCSAGQVTSRGFELNVYAGNLSANGGKTQVIDVYSEREISTDIKSGLQFGARLIYQANPYLGFEVNFGSSLNKYLVRLTVYNDELSTEETTYLGFLHGNILIQPIKGTLSPYLTFGVGVFAFVDSFAPAINYGIGIKCPLGDRLSLRVDIRRYDAWLKDKINSKEWVRKGLFLMEITEISWPYENKLDFFEIAVGLSFRLGRKK